MTHVHFIGIGGTGLSAIARVLLERGVSVSGSDRVISPLAHELAEAGVQVYSGHDPANIQGADLVIRSSAVPDDNPEVQAALQAGVPVLKRADFLAQLTQGQECIAIAGTHGKTTTTAMTAWLLASLDLDPSYIIGGVARNLRSNAHAGTGSYFVIEADEYDYMFLGLQPRAAIVTIVEHDHPDCFPTPADYQAAFERFAGRLLPGGVLLCCKDDRGSAGLAASDAVPADCRALTYGTHPAADYAIRQVKPGAQGNLSFELWYGGERLAQANLQVPGEHNVRNAAAVLALSHQLGLPLERCTQALAQFSGTGRRFDVRGVARGVTLIDDYGHHPTEIRVNLAAARLRYPGQRIWAVWQPHTYSRTQSLLADFAAAFQQADRVIVTEVFAAREKSSTFSARQVVERMSHPGAMFIPSLQETAGYLLDQLKPGDVVLVFSAGDADQVTGWVFKQLQGNEANHDSSTTQAHV